MSTSCWFADWCRRGCNIYEWSHLQSASPSLPITALIGTPTTPLIHGMAAGVIITARVIRSRRRHALLRMTGRLPAQETAARPRGRQRVSTAARPASPAPVPMVNAMPPETWSALTAAPRRAVATAAPTVSPAPSAGRDLPAAPERGFSSVETITGLQTVRSLRTVARHPTAPA